MRRNTEEKQYLHPRNVCSEPHCQHRHCNDSFNAKSERCLKSGLRNVIEKLYTSSHRNGSYRYAPDYFQEILKTVSGLDYEFDKLENLFCQKTRTSYLHYPTTKQKYSLQDVVSLHFTVKSLHKVINSLKEDLIVQDHCTSVEEKQSLFQTKILINGLEKKLFDLLNKVEQLNLQLPQKWSNIVCMKELNHETCPTSAKIEDTQCKRHCNNGGKRNKVYLDKYPKKSNDLWNINTFQNHKCCSKDTPSNKPHNKFDCMKGRNHVSSTIANKCSMTAKETKIKNTTGSHAQDPLDYLSNLPHVCRNNKCTQKSKNVTFIPENRSISDIGESKMKVRRRRRKRTRAGKDHVRKNRSLSHNFKKQNEDNIRYHKKRDGMYKHENDSTDTSDQRKYNMLSISFSESDDNVRNKSTRDINKVRDESSGFWFEDQLEPQNNRKRRRKKYLSSRRGRGGIHPKETRLTAGKHYTYRDNSAFSINKSRPRTRTLKRRRSKKKKRSNVKRIPSSYTSNSNVPYKRRSRNGRKTVVEKRILVSRPKSENINRFETVEEELFQPMGVSEDYCMEHYIVNSLNPSDSDQNYYYSSLCERNVCNNTPKSYCPAYCTYPCCAIQDNYQNIPYPMCSGTCVQNMDYLKSKALVSPIQSENFVIEFEQPRKKKIVKKYIQPKRKVRYSTVSESQFVSKRQNTKSQWLSESYVTSEESLYSKPNSFKIIYYKPPIPPNSQTKYVKLGKFYRESSERIIEYKTPESHVMTSSQATSTETVPSVHKRTSTSEVIKVVKSIGVNTKTPPSNYIKFKSKYTNTENIRSPTEKKRPVVNVGTDPLTQNVKSKATNTIPMKEKDMLKPLTISRGTQPMTILKQSKSTSYDEEPKTVRHVAEISDNIKSRVQVARRQEPEHLQKQTRQQEQHPKNIQKENEQYYQSLSKVPYEYATHIKKQPYEYQEFLKKPQEEQANLISKENVDHAQQLRTGEPAEYGKLLTTKPIEQGQLLMRESINDVQRLPKTPMERGQFLTEETMDYVHGITKKPVEQRQYLTEQPMYRGQLLTKNTVDQGQFIFKEPMDRGQMIAKRRGEDGQLLTKRTMEHGQNITKEPFEQGQYITKEPENYGQLLTKRQGDQGRLITKEPFDQGQFITKEPEDHKQLLTKRRGEQGQLLTKEPYEQGKFITKDSHFQSHFTTQIEPKQPVDYVQVRQSSSEMSMHLVLEKVHEEIFRKRCKFCKCVKKCKCKCCNTIYVKDKVVVCERKKSNIIRITNRPDCFSLNEGEEIMSDVDVKLNLNIPSSCSAICFTNNKVKVGTVKETQSGFCNMTNENHYYPKENECDSFYCPDLYSISNVNNYSY